MLPEHSNLPLMPERFMHNAGIMYVAKTVKPMFAHAPVKHMKANNLACLGLPKVNEKTPNIPKAQQP